LNASAAASPKGSTVVDPDTVTFSCARVGAIAPMNRAIIKIAINLLMISPILIAVARYVKLISALKLISNEK
jgi:hypothetical protein